jgi:hypothetical protein
VFYLVTSISESQGLDSSLIETVDEVLERVLGEVGAGAVYGMLRSRFGFERASIPSRMEYFRKSYARGVMLRLRGLSENHS